jgi:hypothetical protein
VTVKFYRSLGTGNRPMTWRPLTPLRLRLYAHRTPGNRPANPWRMSRLSRKRVKSPVHVEGEPVGPQVGPAPVDVLAPQVVPDLGPAQVAVVGQPGRLDIGAVLPLTPSCQCQLSGLASGNAAHSFATFSCLLFFACNGAVTTLEKVIAYRHGLLWKIGNLSMRPRKPKPPSAPVFTSGGASFALRGAWHPRSSRCFVDILYPVAARSIRLWVSTRR